MTFLFASAMLWLALEHAVSDYNHVKWREAFVTGPSAVLVTFVMIFPEVRGLCVFCILRPI